MTTALQLLEDETDCHAVGSPVDRHVRPRPADALLPTEKPMQPVQEGLL